MAEQPMKTGAPIRITVRLSADHTVQVSGRVTGVTWVEETGSVTHVEIADGARVFDVDAQRYIGE